MIHRRFAPAAIFALLCFGLTALASAAETGPMPVFTSIPPQSYFVQKIAGDRVSVSVMTPPGASPATYEPKPGQMRDLSKATLYFAVGAPFERTWLDRIRSANPDMKVIRTQDGIEIRHMKGRHDHGNGLSHAEAGDASGIPDPHIWLSPPLVILQARNILTALIDADPDHRDAYEANYRAFVSELTELDAHIRRTLAPLEKRRFMVFHPSWGYFADAYCLEQVPAEIEGKNPKPADLQRLIALARENNIRVIFVQPQFSDRSARIIADAVDGRVAEADPLAADWTDNLRQVTRRFAEAMR